MEEKDLNRERLNMETLVNTRFNYLLVVFTVIVTGLTTSKSYLQFKIVILAGVVITAAIGWTIVRAQLKQSILFDTIRKTLPDHPATLADTLSRRTLWWHWCDPRRFSTQRIIGYLFPLAIPLVFLAAFAFRHELYPQNPLEARISAVADNSGQTAMQLARDEGELQYLHKSVEILGDRIFALEARVAAGKTTPPPKRRK
jgi:hypothetical protein